MSRAAATGTAPSRRRLAALVPFLCLLTVLAGPSAVQAQAEAIALPLLTWSEALNLSETPAGSAHPDVVADAHGGVHVFWSEDLNGEPLAAEAVPEPGNAIVYRAWDGYRWTPMIDLPYVSGDPMADFPSAVVDAEGRLHVAWVGMSGYYCSSASAEYAVSAHAWSPPVFLGASHPTLFPLDIGVDSRGLLYVLYASPEGVVHSIHSADGGQHWAEPTEVSGPLERLETSIANVRLLVDAADRLHATWQTNQAQGYGQAVYYAQSTDGGRTWQTPFRFAQRDPGDTFCEWVHLAARGADELHAVYVDGWHIGRWHRISRDGGKSWSRPRRIIDTLEGVNGFVVPLADQAGRLHLIINMRSRDQAHGLYYSIWLGDRWSPVRMIDTTSYVVSDSHFVSAVSFRDEIHIVHTQVRGGEIGYTRGTSSPGVPGGTPARLGVRVPPRAVVLPAQTAPPAGEAASDAGTAAVVSAAFPRVRAVGDQVRTVLLGLGSALMYVALRLVWRALRTRSG